MTGSPEQEENVLKISDEKVEKETMVEFLTSTEKISMNMSEKLYDGGLENWELLVNGDEEYFTSFKGVGKKSAENLLALAKLKKKEIEEMGTVPKLEDVLSGIPRVSDNVIALLTEKGYVSFSSFKDLEPETLQELKGIGPKLSITIIETVNKVAGKYHIDDAGAAPIEDATGIEEEEAEKGEKEEKGIFEKIIDGIKNLFGGKKEEESAEEGSEEEVVEEEEKKEEPAEEKEEVVEEKEPEPEPEEEKKEEPLEEKEEEPEEEEKAEEEEVGFLQKIKNLFGGKKEEEPAEEGSEEEVVEEEKPEEEPVEEKEEVVEEKEPEPEPEEEKKEEKKAAGKAPLGLKGIAKKTQQKLLDSGYLTVDELKEAEPEDLTMIDGIDLKTAKRICNAAKK